MCTVSWFFTAQGYELFVNRDERRSRSIALPPAPASSGQVPYLAPTDTDAGGTWLAASRLGVSVGLLNAEGGGSSITAPLSRGQLVRDLADLEDPAALDERVAALDLSKSLPFTLFALAPGGSFAVVDYDGVRAAQRPMTAPLMLSSSSLIPGGATQPRQEELERQLAHGSSSRQAHLDFHHSHAPSRGPLSPCMHRPDARTVSFSHVRVDDSRVRITYVGGPPCSGKHPVTEQLDRGIESASRAPAVDSD